jgi:flagellar biosynthesis protein FliQ
LPGLTVSLLFAYSQISEVTTPVAPQKRVLLLFAFALFLIFPQQFA